MDGYLKIVELRPSIATENIGDYIIQEYITASMKQIFGQHMSAAVSTRSFLSKANYKLLDSADYTFVCGTNLLSSHMAKAPRQWNLSPIDGIKMRNVILMGVGWWQYQDKPDAYTKWLLHHVLSTQYLHSVRDSYTEDKLKSIGINNVVNTACPTMWNLTPEKCRMIPTKKAEAVITTLTDYKRKYENDRDMLKCLRNCYKTVYIWLQAVEDYAYLKSLNMEDSVQIIPPSLEAFESALQGEVDYVGTRLHGGIRALNAGKRSLILAVDNRAKEISKDTKLPVLERETPIDRLAEIINSDFETKIILPQANIDRWKLQFTDK